MPSLRDLPSVHVLAAELPDGLPDSIARDIARSAIDQARTAIQAGEPADTRSLAMEHARAFLERRPVSVINATGVLLHTNLGRAPLDSAAAEAAHTAATRYSNLEMRLDSGTRGGRGEHAARLAASITGAEAALIVNNNAGALFLVLAALASGREVPVSRGELIEIGGSYRLPELMAASGAIMVEIGTTNRTRTHDYEAACGSATAMLLKVHPSNYRIDGFTEEATVSQLAGVAAAASIPLVFDAGSGLIDATVPWIPGPPPAWLTGEPGIVQSVDEGADLVMFSGDKLLGGPQAGIIVGRGDLIRALGRHPVARAMRIDGPSLAALDVTLERYAGGDADSLPLWRMAVQPEEELGERCRAVVGAAGIDARIEVRSSTLGAGSVPGSRVPTPVIVVSGATDRRYLALLAADRPVVARREEGSLVIDLRAVSPEDDMTVATELGATCRS
jgi:L-seryl-tRNA(Ser) seleniumtransferase